TTDSAPFREESVTYPNGCLTLAAALLLPTREAPGPALVLLQGSGTSDRSNLWARSIAEGLAARGVAVLLTDKRGSGASGGDWRNADMEDLAEDALAGVEYLRGRPEVDAGRIGLLGLSQGGHVAPLAAALDDGVAFTIAASASATGFVEQLDHEMENTFRQQGLTAEQVEEGMRLQHLAERYVETGAWEPFAAALEAAKETPLAPVAAGFPQTPDSWVWSWIRRVGLYDPMPYWKMLRMPVLVVYGREDERDNVPVAESVRRLEAAFAEREEPWEVKVFEGSGHALYEPEGEEPVIRGDLLDLAAKWARGEEEAEEAAGLVPSGR
ncbi:MAG TPA: alpha/beta fold hydrolase, partial [Thermoanaerobaculia bacterium]|nr:alpha/beta fold hydrolase [Thermoanaerobaculia bacterium]